MSSLAFRCVEDRGLGPAAIFDDSMPSMSITPANRFIVHRQVVLLRDSLETRIANLRKVGVDVSEELVGLAAIDAWQQNRETKEGD